MPTPTAFISSLGRPISAGGGSTFGNPSYWDVTLTSNPYYSGTFDGWCLDPTRFLPPSSTGVVNLYPMLSPASGYTTPNTGLPVGLLASSSLGQAGAIAQIDNINWLLNQQFTANPQYSWSEVQAALWGVLGFTQGGPGLVPAEVQQADVDTLMNLSQTLGEGFSPGPDDVFMVLMAPQFLYAPDQQLAQPLILETRFAKLGDFVWNDLDSDGIQDAGEPGIPGVTVTLSGTDIFGELVNRTLLTDGNGEYLFTRLVPGDYTVTFTQPTGYAGVSPRQVGGNAAIDSDGLVSDVIVLKSGEDNRTIDAGFFKQYQTGIDITKYVNGLDANSAPGPTLVVGSTATFTYEVRNTGNVPLASLLVMDDNGTPSLYTDDFPPTYTGGDVNANNQLDISEVWTFSAQRTVLPGLNVNVAGTIGQPVIPGTNTPVPGLPKPSDTDPAFYSGESRDYGDLPSPLYAGVLGAYHVITQNLRIGATATDAEAAAQPNATATGDDIAGTTPDDETGVSFAATIDAGQATTVTVNVSNTSGAAATVVGFIDWNRDGDFLDAGERVAAPVANGFSGNVPLVFNVPAGAVQGQDIGARFRISTDANLDAVAAAANGEVEDYLIRVAQPPQYQTGIDITKYVNGLDANSAPGPTLVVGSTATFTYEVRNTGNVPLASLLVMDDNGTPSLYTDDFPPTYTGGDVNANNQLDISEVWTFSAQRTVLPGLNVNVAGTIGQPVIPGTNTPVPGLPKPSDTDPAFYSGESRDYGDLPSPLYAGVLGAYHVITQNLRIGATATDAEAAAQPNATATGDDIAGTTPDDETGVSFAATIDAGQATTVTVNVSNTSGAAATVVGFIDWNRDGDFLDAGERVAAPVANGFSGNVPLVFNVPAGAVQGQDIGARFRISTDANLDAVAAAANGEVEDYLIRVAQPPQYQTGIDITKYVNGLDANSAPGPTLVVGSTATFTYEVRNTGNVPLASLLVMDDNGTPSLYTDDFPPTYTGGDVNANNQLDISEVWTFSAQRTVLPGLNVNVAGTIGQPVIPGTNTPVPGLPKPSDTDPAFYSGESRDYGDLPSPLYAGVLGAYHVITQNLRIGATATDAEAAAQPNATATGDDIAGTTPDDETGVSFAATIDAGQATTVTVNVSNTSGAAATVVGFIDWNRDGDFLDAGERVAAPVANGFSGNVPLVFNVPAGAVQGQDIGARFRISTDANLDAVAAAANGEVEDYLIRVAQPPQYQTGIDITKYVNGLDANSAPGPTLVVGSTATFTYEVRNTGNVPLASLLVMDDNGTPSLYTDDFPPTYTGGDVNANNQLDISEVWTFSAQRTVLPGLNVNVAGTIGQPVIPGTNTPVPGLPKPSDTDPAFYSGESRDYGDLPSPLYAGVLGAYHVITQNLRIGATATDAEAAAQPNATATGDDIAGTTPDDETGVSFAATIDAGQATTVTVNVSNTSGAAATVVGFIDWNRDGDFLDAGERVAAPVANGFSGNVPLVFNVPAGAVLGQEIGARFRISTDANLDAVATAANGEVEDYLIRVSQQQRASVGNYVWEDLNANGIQDDGATGIAGVLVTLTGGGADGLINGVGDTVVTTTTDGSGFYQFGNLNPGEQYRVGFTKPGAFVSFTKPDATGDALDSDADAAGLTPIVTLAPGEYNDTIDAGLLKPATIGDFVWRDVNGNGVQDGGELGVPNVTVTLTGTDAFGNPVTRTTTTDGSGGYLFNGSTLLPGSYKVSFSNLPAGLAFTAPDQGGDTTDSDANPVTGMTPTVTVGSGGVNRTLDAGLVGTGIDIIKFVNGQDANSAPGPTLVVGSLATFTYEVRNTGDVSLATVAVVDDNGTPANPADDFVPTRTGGDSNGNNLLDVGEVWTYTDTRTVIAGPYTNNATATGAPVYPPGTNVPGVPVPGLTPPTDKDPANYTGESRDYGDLPSPLYAGVLGAYHVFGSQALRIGATLTDAEAAAQPNVAATGDDIAGTTPDDETGVSFAAAINAGQATTVTVNVSNTSGAAATVVGFIDWNRDGDFLDAGERVAAPVADGFSGNVPLVFNVPANAVTGQDLGARFRISADANLDAVTPTNGGEVEDYLIHVGAQRASLGNYVWEDLDADGIQDDGATGIAGVLVTLTGGGADGLINGVGDTVVTTTTDGNGFYQFGNLNPGEQYRVGFTKPGAFVSFTKPDATGDALDSDADAVGLTPIVTLAPGEYNDTIDAGLLKPATIGDFVWRDGNGNGVQDGGEAGVPNVTVTLTGTDAFGNPVTRTTTTDGSGGYLFNGSTLLPGSYKVSFSNLPAGLAFTAPDQGGDTTDSDANPVTGMTPTVTVGSGGVNRTLDAGLVGTGIDIIKFVNGQDANSAPGPTLVVGSLATFTYEVRNTGDVSLATVAVVDDNGTPVVPGDDFAPTYTGGDGNGNSLLDVGEVWTYSATRTVVAGLHTNDAIATGTPVYPPGTTVPGAPVPGLTPPTDHDPANYTGVRTGVVIEKSTNGQDADTGTGPILKVGQIASFLYQISNPGTEPLTNIVVRDDNGTPGVPGDDFAPAAILGGFVQSIAGLGTIRFASLSGTQNNGLGFDVDFGTLGLDEDDIQSVDWALDPVSYQINKLTLVLTEDFNQFGVDAPSTRTSLTLTQDSQGIVRGDGFGASFDIVDGLPVATSSTFFVAPTSATPAGTGFNIGDTNRNNLLDTGETWQYQAARTVTAGQYGNESTVTGQGSGTGTPVTDDDPSHHVGRLPASLGNFVWNDVNRNGIQDAAEANKGVNGVVVTLYGDEDGNGSLEKLRTQLTRDDPTSSLPGYYQFADLTPGVPYQVGFSAPAGFTFTTPNAGANDLIDSDAIVATGRSQVVTLAPGENNPTVDAGLLAPLTVDLTKYVRVDAVDCPTGPIGGIDLGNLTKYLFVFTNGSQDANWQGATKGFAGDVVVNGLVADERSSGTVPYAGTIYTNASSLGAWQDIVDDNPGQAHGVTGQTALVSELTAQLDDAFAQINALSATAGYASVSASSLDGLDTTDGIAKTYVINVTSGLQVSSQIRITGDAGDVFVLRWDTDANGANGYQGQVKFQSGGAIVPQGGLTPANFINVAGDINSSGGGSTPPSPYPQGPRLDDGTGALIEGGSNFSGGGYFTGYWLTTGDPSSGETSPQSNGIFTGGWYSTTSKFSMTSGTSGVHVCPEPSTLPAVLLQTDSPFNAGHIGVDANSAPYPSATPGDKLTFTYRVENTSTVPLTVTSLIDDNATTGKTSDDYTPVPVLDAAGRNVGDSNANGQFDPGESWYYQAMQYANFSGVRVNSATVIAADAAGGTATDTDVAGVRVGPGSGPRPASLGDYVWNDANANGLQDGTEAGIGGLLVTLTGGGADGVINGSGDTTATTTTRSDGFYEFASLTPGVQYQVTFSKPAGTSFTTRDANGNGSDTVDSDADPTTGKTAIVTLAAGESNPTLDAGIVYPPGTGGISIVKEAGVSTVASNVPVTFTYAVRNTGSAALSNVVVSDDNATPAFAADDFHPAPVLQTGGPHAGRNIGDIDGDNLLDTNEIWRYVASVVPAVRMTTTSGGDTHDSGTLTYTTLPNGDIRVFYQQSLSINDNNYAESGDAPTWNRGHKFNDLVGSDKAEFAILATDGTLLLEFTMDYISEVGSPGGDYSGYQSEGLAGVGGGTLKSQAETLLKDFDSTLELNLNRPGYTDKIVNSPVGDPNWEQINGYLFTIDKAAFGSKAFGGVVVLDQHNSPSKVGSTDEPVVVGGPSVNTALVTAKSGGATVSATDDATVVVSAPKTNTMSPTADNTFDAMGPTVLENAASAAPSVASAPSAMFVGPLPTIASLLDFGSLDAALGSEAHAQPWNVAVNDAMAAGSDAEVLRRLSSLVGVDGAIAAAL